MNWEDVDNALQFLPLMEQGIVLECSSRDDVPSIKRYIRSKLGTPGREIGDRLFYNRRYVIVISISSFPRSSYGYRMEQLFYVRRQDEQDDIVIDNLGFDACRFPNQLDLWNNCSMYPGEMVERLVSEGYNGLEALVYVENHRSWCYT